METELVDMLEDVGWSKKLELKEIETLLTNWTDFSKLVSWISLQLKAVTEIEENVNEITKPDDVGIFQLELSSFLKELRCAYEGLTSDELSKRFLDRDKKLLALNFLVSELQASRMIYANTTKQLTVSLSESQPAKFLGEILQTLDCEKPPDNITSTALCSIIEQRISNLKKLKNLEEDSMFQGVLSQQQWQIIDDLNVQFQLEYQMRREMLLKRLHVTVQSFNWSDRLKSKKDDVTKLYEKHRGNLGSKPMVGVCDVLAARIDLAVIEKSSCTSVRKNTRSAINSVTIGRVPDRGGRPDEVQPPPPEMPPWQQRQNTGGGPSGSSGWIQGGNQNQRGGGGRGRGDGSRGGGRVQGGWSHSKQQGQGGNTGRGQSGNYDQQLPPQQSQHSDQYSSRQYQQNAPQYQSQSYDSYNNPGYGYQDQYSSNGSSGQGQGRGGYDQGNSRPQRGQGGGGHRGGGNRGYNRY